jgi:quercetin dioxygenase-like cupin family protein
MVEVSSGKPYAEVLEDGYIIREFAEDVPSKELVWHRDKKDRTVEVLEGEGWKFQYDNELPFDIEVGDTFTIEAMEYHRLIKGKTNLLIRITEDG